MAGHGSHLSSSIDARVVVHLLAEGWVMSSRRIEIGDFVTHPRPATPKPQVADLRHAANNGEKPGGHPGARPDCSNEPDRTVYIMSGCGGGDGT